jgi:ribosome maturation factor RimP
MISIETKQKIESLARQVIEQGGAELVEINIGGNPRDVLIQVTADRPAGGITMGECSRLNKALVSRIEGDNILSSDNFSLELSSPGLDRTLVSRKDFMRVLGRELHVWLHEPVGGKKEVQGILTQVGDSALTLEAGSTQLVLPLPAIIRGKSVI